MNKIYILTLLMGLMMLSGCTEEKTFKLEGKERSNVNFTVVNESLGDSITAYSALYEHGFYPAYSESMPEYREIDITYYDVYDGIVSDYAYAYTRPLNGYNTIWAGGYNYIVVKFTPSCPEEKSALFTMPDGQTFELTASNPEVRWYLDKDAYAKSKSRAQEMGTGDTFVITAESEYTKNGTTYSNIGYAVVDCEPSLCFNAGVDKWLRYEWTYNDPMRLREKLNFVVTNLTVGNGDYAESAVQSGYGDYNRRNAVKFEYFPKSYIGNKIYIDYSRKETYTYDLYQSDQLWAGGNNELQITYRPTRPEEKSVKFTMPDGKVVELNPSDTTFVWKVDYETMRPMINNNYYSGTYEIKAESSYETGNTVMTAEGYVQLQLDGYYLYNPADGNWYDNDWMANEPLRSAKLIDFTVTNLTVGTTDNAKSSLYEGYYNYMGYNERNVPLTLKYCFADNDSIQTENTYEYEYNLMYTNALAAGGNNNLRLQLGDIDFDGDLTLTWPDKQTTVLNKNKKVAEWNTGISGLVFNDYNAIMISGEYKKDNILYELSGYVLVDSFGYLYYEPSLGIWVWK